MQIGKKQANQTKDSAPNKNPIAPSILLKSRILVFVQVRFKHSSSSTLILEGFCFKHEHAFELLLAFNGELVSLHHDWQFACFTVKMQLN